MERKTIEETVVAFGFEGREKEGSNEETIYNIRSPSPFNVIIDGTELFVNKAKFLQFEFDEHSIVVRINYNSDYVGCIVKCFEEINSFELRKGY